MNNEDEFLKLTKSGSGWISPTGQIVACETYEHFTVLYKFSDISKYVQEYENICQENDEYMWACLDALEEDEHPEMHRFDGMNQPAEFELIKALYSNGYRRIGSRKDRHGKINYCSVEGYGKPTKTQQKQLDDLSLFIGVDLVQEEVTMVKDGSYEYHMNVKFVES